MTDTASEQGPFRNLGSPSLGMLFVVIMLAIAARLIADIRAAKRRIHS